MIFLKLQAEWQTVILFLFEQFELKLQCLVRYFCPDFEGKYNRLGNFILFIKNVKSLYLAKKLKTNVTLNYSVLMYFI